MSMNLISRFRFTIVKISILCIFVCIFVFLGALLNTSILVFAKQFTANMVGGNEVPPVSTNGTGYASFRTSVNDTVLKYKVNMTGLSEITGAQILQGKVGQNGDVIIDLWNDSKKNTGKPATTIRGNITNSDLLGPMKGKILDTLLAAVNTGDTYVNVNTSSHPSGEIRGQIK
jgi:hypothetical protein